MRRKSAIPEEKFYGKLIESHVVYWLWKGIDLFQSIKGMLRENLTDGGQSLSHLSLENSW
jgi:hypothetical protein